MKERIIKTISKNYILSSAAITCLLFIPFLILGAPIIDSDDNFFILYTLAGGYGQPPTHLLHYYYEWHPFLFWPIAKLFHLYQGFNWYTGFLLALHLVSSMHLLLLFLKLFKKWQALALFLLFFLFFESVYLLSLNHSNTSLLLAISGCSYFLYHFSCKSGPAPVSIKYLAFPSLLLLISGLLRIPTLGLYVFMTLGMGLVVLPIEKFKKMFLALALIGMVLLAFMTAHWIYYTSKIPHYEREEQFRQSLFYLANHPITSPGGDTGIAKVKNSFLHSWFLYDTGFITQEDIDAYTQKAVQNRIRNHKENGAILYWTFINSRVYLFLLLIIFASFLAFRKYRSLKLWLLMSLAGIMIYLYLAIFMKITEGIFIAILCSMFFSAVFCWSKEKAPGTPLRFAVFFLLLLNTGWILMRLKKTNEANLQKIEETRSLLKELGAHPKLLFVNTDKEFKDRGFYIWDTPQQFPLINFINKELLVTNMHKKVLQRYGISDLMNELPAKKNIILFDKVEPLLPEFYRIKKGMKVKIDEVPGFTHINAHHANIVSR